MVLLLLLIVAVHAVFLIEQPRGSDDVFPYHERFSWFVNKICYVPRADRLKTLKLLQPQSSTLSLKIGIDRL